MLCFKGSMGTCYRSKLNSESVHVPINSWKNMTNFFCLWGKIHKYCLALVQRAKKVVSDSQGLVDFSIVLVNSVINLPDGQNINEVFWGIQITEELWNQCAHQNVFGASYSWNDVWASKCYLQLAPMASCKNDFLCILLYLLIFAWYNCHFQFNPLNHFY